jgi:hypothetical protein
MCINAIEIQIKNRFCVITFLLKDIKIFLKSEEFDAKRKTPSFTPAPTPGSGVKTWRVVS